MSIFERYLELNNMIKEATKEMDTIKGEIMEQIPEDGYQSELGKIVRVKKLMPKLKPGVSVTEVMDKCPEAIDYKPNTKWLSEHSEGHEFIEFAESVYIMVSKGKVSE